jgi:hypothetical protein
LKLKVPANVGRGGDVITNAELETKGLFTPVPGWDRTIVVGAQDALEKSW